LSRRWNIDTDGTETTFSGSAFHICGVDTSKVRLPTAYSLNDGTTRQPVLAERGVRRAGRSAARSRSQRYRGGDGDHGGTLKRVYWVAASQKYCKKLKNSGNINIWMTLMGWINLLHQQSVEYLVTQPAPAGPVGPVAGEVLTTPLFYCLSLDVNNSFNNSLIFAIEAIVRITDVDFMLSSQVAIITFTFIVINHKIHVD